MLRDGESDEEKMRIHSMFIEENRVKSFKDWVFDSCECTPKKVQYVAEVGKGYFAECDCGMRKVGQYPTLAP